MPVASTRRVTSTNGVEIALHDFGGSGPTLLFAHATGFHAMVWAPLARHLVDQFHCLGIDFRGHGDSSVPDHRGFEWSGFADDVLATVEALGRPTPLFGVGHSKGGAALLLAEQRSPGAFTALYCFEPIVMPLESRRAAAEAIDEHPLAAGARRRREHFASRDEAFAHFAAKPPLDALDPDVLRAYVDHGFADRDDGSVELKCRGEHEGAVYSMSTSHDAFDHLHMVRCPVTVASGAHTEGSPARLSEPVAEALPAGRYEQHDHLGHFGPLEQPRFVAEQIRRAFAR
jgi:pimeloyl-ACP methyl ester carboxylesterase